MRSSNAIKLKIGRNVRRLIGRLGMTPNAFAVKCGISDGTVYNWMSGVTSPSIGTACGIAEALDMKPMELLSELTEGTWE